jgi:hypothetical protein
MNNETTTSSKPKGRSEPLRLPWRWLVCAVVALVAVGAFSRLLAGPSFVDHIAINNKTDYSLWIEVAGAGRRGWLGLGGISHDRVKVTGQVIDQGQAWVFRIRAQGQVAGEFTVGRSDLVRNNWTVSIPSEIETYLRSAGVPPDPEYWG